LKSPLCSCVSITLPASSWEALSQRLASVIATD
jgi:hypothetical protein